MENRLDEEILRWYRFWADRAGLPVAAQTFRDTFAPMYPQITIGQDVRKTASRSMHLLMHESFREYLPFPGTLAFAF